jgi:hypothetical protein
MNYLVEKYLEYKNDIVKFAEECVYVEQSHGVERIKLDNKQKEIIDAFNKHHNLCLLTTRQSGVSTVNKILMVHTMIFNDLVTIGIISRDQQFMRDIEFMLDKIPINIVPKYIIKNINRIVLENGTSIIQVFKPNPHSSFLGNSLNILIVEDAAHIKDLDLVMNSLSASLAKVQEVSKDLNKPYGIIIYSDPGISDPDNYFRKLWKDSKEGKTIYTPMEICWKNIPRLSTDPDWYTRMCTMLYNDKTKIDRELNLEFI